jgi:hypothetical protein
LTGAVVDFQQPQDRRDPSSVSSNDGQAKARKRAEDARLRRAIREAFARQRGEGEPRRDSTPLHVVRPTRP